MFEQNDDKTIMSFIVQNCPVFYFTKEEQNFPLDVEQFLRKCQLKHIATPQDVYCSSIQNLFLEKRYLIQGKTRSPLTDKEFYIQPSRKVNMLNHITKSILYTRLTVNSNFIRVSYMMFFKENEGAIHKDDLLGQQHGDWKHVSLYFDKTTQELMYAVLHNHFTKNQVVSADNLQFETVSGHYRPVFYVAQGTHSIYPAEGDHQVDILCESTTNGKKWMPRNIIFLPETLQRARRTKSSWVYYRGQYGSDKAYGPVYQPWWNQDPEFIEYINDVGMGDFKIRGDRIEELSTVIEETTERIRSRTRPQTEVNRSRLHKTASTIKRLSNIQPTTLTQKAEVLLEKQKYIEAEEQTIQTMKKELETKMREFQEQQEQLQRHQHKLLQNQESLEEQRKQQEAEQVLLQEKEQAFLEREKEINHLKQKLTSDIEEVVQRKKKIECEEKELEELRTKIHQIETREKELEVRQGQMKKERDSIRNMITQGMQKSQEDYSTKKKELIEQERQLHITQHQLSEKSKELRDLEEQLQEMTDQLEQRQTEIQQQEEYIKTKQLVFESQKDEFEKEKEAYQKKEEKTNKAIQTTQETDESLMNLQSEIRNLRERTSRLTQREVALESQIVELQQEIDTIQKEASSSLSSLQQNYEAELNKVKESLQSRDKRIHQLEVLLQSTKKQHKEHHKEQSVQEEKMASLRTSLEESLEKEKELKENIQSLEIQLTAQTRIVEHMCEELETTEKKLIDSVDEETYQREPTEDMSIGAKVALVLRQRDQEIQNLRHYIETVENKVHHVEKAKNDSQTELERLQKEFNDLETKYQEEVEGKVKTQEEYTTLIDGVQQQVIHLTTQLNQYKEKEQEWKRTHEHTRQQCVKSQQDQRKVHQQLTLLRKEYNETRKLVQSKTKELEIVNQAKEALENTVQKAKDRTIQQEKERQHEYQTQLERHKQEIDLIKQECSVKVREAHDVLKTHQTTINDQSKQLEQQRQQLEKQKQELNTRMTRMIDKADLVQSEVRVAELQQALNDSQHENKLNREKKEKYEKLIEEQEKRLHHMETQVNEWKKQHESIQQVARKTEQKYTRILQEVDGYKSREQDIVSREKSMETQKQEWEREMDTVRSKHILELQELKKRLEQPKVSEKPSPPPKPQQQVGNLMFTQNRAPVLGRRRQVRRVRG